MEVAVLSWSRQRKGRRCGRGGGSGAGVGAWRHFRVDKMGERERKRIKRDEK